MAATCAVWLRVAWLLKASVWAKSELQDKVELSLADASILTVVGIL